VELVIGGMTCAACAARVERRLTKLDGVRAAVNLATEKARVDYPDGMSSSDIIREVEAAGYTAELPPRPEDVETSEQGEDAGGDTIYLEVAAGVTTFILIGRFFESRSRRRAGAALRALLELGAKEVAVLRDGGERRITIEELAVGDRFVVRPGEKVASDGVVE